MVQKYDDYFHTPTIPPQLYLIKIHYNSYMQNFLFKKHNLKNENLKVHKTQRQNLNSHVLYFNEFCPLNLCFFLLLKLINLYHSVC